MNTLLPVIIKLSKNNKYINFVVIMVTVGISPDLLICTE